MHVQVHLLVQYSYGTAQYNTVQYRKRQNKQSLDTSKRSDHRRAKAKAETKEEEPKKTKNKSRIASRPPQRHEPSQSTPRPEHETRPDKARTRGSQQPFTIHAGRWAMGFPAVSRRTPAPRVTADADAYPSIPSLLQACIYTVYTRTYTHTHKSTVPALSCPILVLPCFVPGILVHGIWRMAHDGGGAWCKMLRALFLYMHARGLMTSLGLGLARLG